MSASFLPLLVEMALKATVLLGLAWIAGLLLKNRSAALRHTMRTCALTAVLLLPVLSYLMPAWRWQGLPRFLMSATQNARASETPAALPMAPARANHNAKSTMTESAMTEPPANDTLTTTPAVSKSRPAWEWPQVLTMIWLVGIALIGLRLLISRLRLALLVR